MSVYDEYYKTENLFGNPYKELIDFFLKFPEKGKLLDLGCGQGRDALPLAKLGYQVTAIDDCEIGLNQLKAKASLENIKLNLIKTDIYKFEAFDEYDIVLLDSMFHFEKKDKKKETTFLKRILEALKPQNIICICIQNSGKKVSILKQIFSETKKFEMLKETHF